MKLVQKLLSLGLCTSLLTGCTMNQAKENNDQTTSDITVYKDYASTNQIPLQLQEVTDNYLQPASQQGKVVQFDYTSYTYDAENRSMNKYAYVYVPYGYDTSDEKYDVFYVMHGHTGDVTTFIGDLDDPRDMKNVLDNLIEKGEMKPMLIVFASYYHDNIEADTDNYDVDLLRSFKYELQNDLMPQFESTYRTYANSIDEQGLIDSRDHRGFIGFSMGGVTTWLRLMDSLRYFRYFVPLSGSLYWVGQDIVSQYGMNNPSWTANILIQAIQAQGYTADDFYILSMTGTEDFTHGSLEMQINDMKQHEEMFHHDETEVNGNLAYFLAKNEEHDYHAKRLYLFNAFPILSALIERQSKIAMN